MNVLLARQLRHRKLSENIIYILSVVFVIFSLDAYRYKTVENTDGKHKLE